MNYITLQVSSHGPVAKVILNRPELHNAFDETLIGELTDCFAALDASSDVRVVILTGAGKSFCAGADLSWMGRMAGYSEEENVTDARALQKMFETIDGCSKATIARIHGAAVGGGVGLAAVCDIAVAVPEAKFAFSEARLGLLPAVISPYVIRKTGPGTARALFVTAERFDADRALRIGLVHRLVSAEELDPCIAEISAQLLLNGPLAIAACKSLISEVASSSPTEAGDLTVRRIAAARVGAEGQEGIAAFLAKRKANFAVEQTES